MGKEEPEKLVESPFSSDNFVEEWIKEAKMDNAVAVAAAEKALREHPMRMIDGLKIEKISRDYIVEVPVEAGKVFITFTEILRSRQSFEAVLTVQVEHAKEGKFPAFERRIDVNSASAIDTFATALNSAIGNKKEGYNWVLILNRAGVAMKKLMREEKKATIFTADDVYEKSTYLVEHLLETGSPTLIHGDGSTGKSYFTLYMAVCAALGRDFFGKKTTPFKTLYLDHESTASKLKNRMHRIANGLGVPFAELADKIHWYKPDGSLANEQEIIARMVEDGGYGCIIVDAGASASGGSPLDEQAVLKMFTALDHIPCAKLIIHHEPKDASANDDKAYYGTTFWRNAPRLAWRLKREGKTENRSVIKAVHHKANDDGESMPFTYAMDFPANEVKVTFELTDSMELGDDAKIIEYLLGGEADIKAIADNLDISRATVQRRVGELLVLGKLGQKRVGKKHLYFVQ